jgi:hypothetical protein
MKAWDAILCHMYDRGPCHPVLVTSRGMGFHHDSDGMAGYAAAGWS